MFAIMFISKPNFTKTNNFNLLYRITIYIGIIKRSRNLKTINLDWDLPLM